MKNGGLDASEFAFSLLPLRMPPLLAPAVDDVSIAVSLFRVELPLLSPSASRSLLAPIPEVQVRCGKGFDVRDVVEALGNCEEVRWDCRRYGGAAEFPAPERTEA